ncbi:ABC-F family ATP-binding cassette domain-containing protein [Aquibacillus salsiterrae]|uniref:ABC-F family ATP-binding cassette domain-containing protein n=1 Tax=Aquibacillus salsiterrae TaxID=2950439 RepID=A0A9X3WCB6_9BACI|nr:ABC-F family ATP-binding cassette domain-containing protein [Aquibacillus salsiterrae]MDC3416832.1 ABC-F family ATP-binding cassette domain-containing protein [Aquibacillus salsiterrae]
MSILSVENLYKSYGDKVLFQSISFSIEARERIGLIGVNGTGKSTLLKVLAGIESKEAGEMKHANDFRVQYLSQEPVLDLNLTVLEQIYYGESDVMKVMRSYEKTLLELGQDPENEKLQDRLINVQQQMDQYGAWDANTTAKMILTKLGITAFDKKIQDLSGGQKKRVAIASALIQPADLLILDEPTNHLDNPTIEWLEGYLPQYKGAIILVTHDRYFLNRITNHIYELDKGNLYIYEGNYQTFLTKKAEREEQELLSEQKHKNTLRRELEWLQRGAKARTTKQKARIQRVEEMKEKNFDTSGQSLDFQVGSTRLGKKVMEVDGISKAFAGETVVDNFNLLITPNDRLGIIGPNGSGKTTLLNMLAGKIEPDKGTIDVGPTVKIGYYTQDHSEMDENLRVIEYVREEAEVIHTIDGDTITAEQMLERFLFPRSQQWTYIRKLSGGERRRLYLLRVLMGEPNVLFLDEPTNDLDTQTLGVLEDYLDVFPGVVITVSHDRYFLDRVVEQLIVFRGKGKTDLFYGNYSELLEKTTADKKLEQDKVTKGKPEQRQTQRKKKLSYKDQQEWDQIEDTITELELAIEEAKDKIVEAGSDLEKVQKHFQKQQELEAELEAKMERWEELSILVEEIENQ